MKYLQLPISETRILPFYLAMEEYAARIIGDDDIFFMWQVNPTVIFGRNQLIENEVNIPYCREHGIATYRRKSGGGCVFADMSNIMMSYITRSDNVEFTYRRYTHAVVDVLRKLGLNASDNGRNDILIDGLKVSGNAFYHLPGRSIVHGTMLYDTNMVNMVGAITPNDEKLISKGVESVRQRIALLKDFVQIDIEQFKTFVRENLCKGEITLTSDDIRAIEEIEKEYLTDEFVYGNNPKYTVVRKGRIEGVGEFEVRIEVKNGVIKGLTMLGDYFIVGDVDAAIVKPLKGVKLSERDILEALPDNLETTILNLKKEDFVNLLLRK